MKYYRIKPSASIAPYVKYFWVGEADVDNGGDFRHFSIATSNARLVFHYKGHFKECMVNGEWKDSFLSGLQGQSKAHTRFVSNDHVGIFGIEFFPYAIPFLFSISAVNVTNQFLELRDLYGVSGENLQDQILSASSDNERVNIATRFIESVMQPFRHPFVIDAVQQINTAEGEISISGMIRQYGISERKFERLFKELIGFSPKSYARVRRFESAVSRFPVTPSFTGIALDSGYYDQSHFIHDFRAFTGLSPKDYRKLTILKVASCGTSLFK